MFAKKYLYLFDGWLSVNESVRIGLCIFVLIVGAVGNRVSSKNVIQKYPALKTTIKVS